MKLIIEIDEEIYKSIKIGMRNRDDMAEIGEAVENGTPIPDNATNGDVVQMIFPYAEYNTYVDVVNRIAMADKDFEIHFDEDWWDSPYQRGGKVE